MLDGAVGYVSKCGVAVLYGQRTPPKPRPIRTRGWPDGDDKFKPVIEDSFVRNVLRRLPKKKKGPAHSRNTPIRVCAACDDTTHTTAHHVKPRTTMTRDDPMYSVTVRLCEDCHVRIHALFSNAQLACMTWDAQKAALTSD